MAQLPGDSNHVFKVLLIGACGVGKTCLLRRFADHSFVPTTCTSAGVDFRTCRVLVENGKSVTLQVWDVAGQEKFHSVLAPCYRRVSGVVIVFDVTSAISFEHVHSSLAEIERFTSGHMVRVLVGNKDDLVETRVVDSVVAQNLAESLGLLYFETSAKVSHNVNEMFSRIASAVLHTFAPQPAGTSRLGGLRLPPAKKEHSPRQESSACWN